MKSNIRSLLVFMLNGIALKITTRHKPLIEEASDFMYINEEPVYVELSRRVYTIFSW